MKISRWVAVTLLMTANTACISLEGDDDDINHKESARDEMAMVREHYPFHVVEFDHEPTEAERHSELLRFAMAQADSMVIGPIDWMPPGPGQKLVQIDARTSNIESAGTDDANHVRFTGLWQANNLQQYSEDFILDKPSRDDLDRNQVYIFYYLLNVRQYNGTINSDRFVSGRLSNSSTDGWHCASIKLHESKYTGTSRTQSMPFNQWVDSPSLTPTPFMAGNNLSWLDYF